MNVLFYSEESDVTAWKHYLTGESSDLYFHDYTSYQGSNEDIEFVIINPRSAHILDKFPNLKGIFSLFAGVDSILPFKDYIPEGIPVIRLVSSDLTRGMTEYIIYHVLRYYRQFDQYMNFQKNALWKPVKEDNRKRSIGIMGLGELGVDAALKLQLLGFQVSGWSRSKKTISNITSYAGYDELSEFLSASHILISLLPLTSETEGIIDHHLINKLPKGACIINVARGKQIVQGDLLAALDSGHLQAATLDVFDIEPLPLDHVFWQHPKITMTPHIASVTRPCQESAKWFVDNMRLLKNGKKPLGGIVNLDKGY